MTKPDSVEIEAHAVVKKWSASQMKKVQKDYGRCDFDGDELEAMGIKPAKVTTDVEAQ